MFDIRYGANACSSYVGTVYIVISIFFAELVGVKQVLVAMDNQTIKYLFM